MSSDVSNEYKERFNLDIKFYEDFNKLIPYFVKIIIEDIGNLQRIIKNQDERTNLEFHARGLPIKSLSIEDDINFPKQKPVVDMEECLLQTGGMDVYLEKVLSCMGTPVHSLETLEIQASAAFAFAGSHESIAYQLSRYMDLIIKSLEGRTITATEQAISKLSLLLNQIIAGLENNIYTNFHQGTTIDTDAIALDIQNEISRFLKDNEQCVTFPQSAIEQLVVKSIGVKVLSIEHLIMGKQITGEKERDLTELIKEMSHARREIIALCFPDYFLLDNEKNRNEEHLQLAIIKRNIQFQMESLVVSRDPKMVKNMLPYFEEGGSFCCCGCCSFERDFGGVRDSGL